MYVGVPENACDHHSLWDVGTVEQFSTVSAKRVYLRDRRLVHAQATNGGQGV